MNDRCNRDTGALVERARSGIKGHSSFWEKFATSQTLNELNGSGVFYRPLTHLRADGRDGQCRRTTQASRRQGIQ